MVETQRLMSTTVANLGAGTDRRVVVRAIRTGLWIWPSFALLDVYMCLVAYPEASLLRFLGYRVVVELLLFVVYQASRRESSDVETLFSWLSVSFRAAALGIALMAVELGGIQSPYMHGISIVALVWAALVPASWRRSLPIFLQIGLCFPLVIGLFSLISPSSRELWFTREALTVFVSNYVFVVASSVLSVVLCHLVFTALQEARELGSYQLEELLGHGGMGEVWRAKHRLLVRRAAIKLVRPEALGAKAEDQKLALARFEREAQATALLQSPHTIQIYDFGVTENGTFFYVMELLDGFDAEVLVQRFGPLPAARVVHILEQMCDSLAEAHARGLVHRDIKPSNVYVCRHGRAVDFVKLLDFGLVKQKDALAAELTQDNVISGTPAFMAPEQALGDKPVEARTDLYALGCVAYWLLTGRYVFEGKTYLQVISEHVYAIPVPPSAHTEQAIPEELERLVLACLKKQPEERPESADRLSEALRALASDHPWSNEDARAWWDRHAA